VTDFLFQTVFLVISRTARSAPPIDQCYCICSWK